ncbi:P-loop containing nucleoside triphosphate hydrolase protein [Chytridium lagenaria]|nr:P-loop containing nucleoside triphosphate hydrolase protein [Chytridium lagenaria]
MASTQNIQQQILDSDDTNAPAPPEDSASTLKRLLFTHLDPLLRLGYKRPLDVPDIPRLPDKLKARAIGDVFEGAWEKELAKATEDLKNDAKKTELPKKRPLLKAMWRFMARHFLTAAIPNFARPLSVPALEKMLKISPAARARLTSGKIINVIVSDTNRIDLAMQTLPNIYSAPFVIMVASVLLIINLGWSALIGLGVLLIYLPCQNWIQKTMGTMRTRSNKIADERIRITSEALAGIRVIKSYAWEPSFRDVIADLRIRELKWTRIYLLLRSSISGMSQVIPALAMVATFIAFQQLEQDLDAATVFSSLSLFYVLRSPLLMIPLTISQATDAWIAVGRLEEILTSEEITDAPLMLEWNHSDDEKRKEEGGSAEPALVIKGAEFIWAGSGEETTTQQAKEDANGEIPLSPTNSRSFVLKVPDLSIPRGSLIAIIGTVGSGKSSFLQALVGEMKRTHGEVIVRGSLGWCPQQPWVLNRTVRGNVVFGGEWEEKRYWETVGRFGERGINLSGGQKQRLSLARAVYFGADVILLDDPLSAVDAHVGRALFDHCIRGTGSSALGGKTRLLVTHQLHVLPHVDRILVIDHGEIIEDGTYEELMAKENGATRLMMEEFGGVGKQEEGESGGEKEIYVEVEKKKSVKEVEVDAVEVVKKEKDGKLIQAEERQVGVVTFGTLWEYVVQGGGIPTASAVLFGALAAQVARIMTDNWLAYWSSKRYELPNTTYAVVYAALGLAQAVFLVLFSFALVYAGLWSSQNMHILAVERVMRAPVSFFDTTPLGRLITRFSRDVDMMDNTLPETFRTFLFTLSMTLANFGLIAAIFPAFLGGLLPAIVLFYFFQRYYSSSSREIRRLDSVTRSALFAHVSETLSGIATIRAYARQEMFIDDNLRLLDANGRMYYMSILVPIWLSVRLETISAILILLASLFAVVYRYQTSPGLAGLTISYAVNIMGVFNWCVRQSAEVEQNLNSVERLGFLIHDIPQERDFKPDGGAASSKPVIVAPVPEEWPQKGEIEFNSVEMRYRPDLPLVLKGIKFSIKAGEKCGIVGRTGAGKSSILVALLRLVENSSGSVNIDGLDTSTIPLARLRSSVSVIPQDPVLFSGTIRSNLDPFSQYSDDAIWKALEKSDLKQSISENPEGLDTVVTENGENFSTGQRQLICLARALLKSSKIILLDEATASVDLRYRRLYSTSHPRFLQRRHCYHHRASTQTLSQITPRSWFCQMALSLRREVPRIYWRIQKGPFTKMVDETGLANAAAIRAIASMAASPKSS